MKMKMKTHLYPMQWVARMLPDHTLLRQQLTPMTVLAPHLGHTQFALRMETSALCMRNVVPAPFSPQNFVEPIVTIPLLPFFDRPVLLVN
jgi:hypothetical protein